MKNAADWINDLLAQEIYPVGISAGRWGEIIREIIPKIQADARQDVLTPPGELLLTERNLQEIEKSIDESEKGKWDYNVQIDAITTNTPLQGEEVNFIAGFYLRDAMRMQILSDASFIISAHNEWVPQMLKDLRTAHKILHDVNAIGDLEAVRQIRREAYQDGWNARAAAKF